MVKESVILIILSFVSGFISSDIIIKKLKIKEVNLLLKTLDKEYKIRIHHLYASLLALFTLVYDLYISIFLLGVGTHDLIIELRKKLQKLVNS